MIERINTKSSGSYFPHRNVQFIRTGCTLLDCVLGGGWVLGRIANIIGTEAAGKTLLAIEAAANFARQYPKGRIWYREAEAAFDVGYAESVGLPVKRVDFGPEGIDTLWDTIEDIFEDLDKQIKAAKKASVPGLYIVDSLDALSSRAELERKIDEGSYGMEKQKRLGELLRRLSRAINEADVCLLIISQVRANIGVIYGPKFKRSGGKSLDFYASHILWLSHMKNLTRTINGVKRTTAIQVKAKCSKNKVGPLRECEFNIRFGYGVDELAASLDWLSQIKRLDLLGLTEAGLKKYADDVEDIDSDERYGQELDKARSAVQKAWAEVEKGFEPIRRKYS